MIRRLVGFLETTFDCKVTDAAIKQEIKNTNLKNKLLNQIFDFAPFDRA
ncbi:MAG: 2-hydroxyacyl-CoA dehydratase family protein [Smithella sp.]